ncbi:hypothetical protein, partial [Clostridium sp. AN503]|uniref:hypothetical protein n=1 Tax=Clostridium sp. AN503 TaxID=3160598 RepID=UPI00345AD0FE
RCPGICANVLQEAWQAALQKNITDPEYHFFQKQYSFFHKYCRNPSRNIKLKYYISGGILYEYKTKKGAA